MPKVSGAPTPKKRYHGGRWRIYWYSQNRLYSVATNYFDNKNDVAVTVDLRHISSALAMEQPVFPEKYASQLDVIRYMDAHHPSNKPAIIIPESDEILASYDEQNSAECVASWARNSRRRLKTLAKCANGILNVTPVIAANFLANILKERKAATRNQALVVCNKFFKEMVRLSYITVDAYEKQ